MPYMIASVSSVYSESVDNMSHVVYMQTLITVSEMALVKTEGIGSVNLC